MAENSKIQWTHHTFNPWRGCTKVSEGCAHCYAESMSARNPAVLGEWGPTGTRVVAAESYWREPAKWNRAAEAAGGRRRVFCASLADVFEDWPGTMSAADGAALFACNECGAWRTMERMCHGPSAHYPVTMDDARERLFKLIGATPYLDWLLLTKRPENVVRLTRRAIDPFYAPGGNGAAEPNGLDAAAFGDLYPNVWLGTSAENQRRLDERAPHLLRVPARVRFVSAEPLLGPLDLRRWLDPVRGVNWVIVGGESGAGARPFDPDWARVIVDQCQDAGVACFVKQMGQNPVGLTVRKKGGELDDIPADLRVREFPQVQS